MRRLPEGALSPNARARPFSAARGTRRYLRDLTRPPNREVANPRDARAVIGEDMGVELHHRVPLVHVIGHDACAQRQAIAKPRRSEILDAAARMDPRSEHHILEERLVREAQELAGMHQPRPRIEGLT